LLSRYGQNFSQQVEYAGHQFARQERTSQLETLVSTLASGNGSIAVIGEVGIGKTALLYGLADHLLQSPSTAPLSGHQVIALNASVLLSLADQPGSLERIMLALFAEAHHAGNIIIALDEAQLFFGQGTGAVNLSQILLPILQARSIRIVLTLTPGDWQKLKSTNAAMSSLVSPLILSEPKEAEVIDLLADRALTLETPHSVITYAALREAYRLSSRYFQDEANPGRALKLLSAAANQPLGGYITDVSVQRAVEGQLGVRVEKATDQEADVLLHLEDLIHQRMVNQTHAVKSVAAALRRSRAGVSSPNRPVGSFLFLGPTGVGKTELAKSLAALYFGSEDHLIRLDMSEYQQPTDVARLLESAAENSQSFLTRVRTTPFSVVLLDEIEKAHPNILNLLLQMLDEGALTDTSDKSASFKDSIVIATSNAGADEIRAHITAGEDLEDFADAFNDQLIASGSFKPELINRFDDIILFRPLKPEELGQVVLMMLGEVNKTLSNQDIKVELTSEAVALLVDKGNDPRLGARPMRRMIQRQVEDSVAARILSGAAKAGDTIRLDAKDVA
jgi:ATP-dependent Clp protease ATP-binding subunit ClpC